jgi:hypothetical protein
MTLFLGLDGRDGIVIALRLFSCAWYYFQLLPPLFDKHPRRDHFFLFFSCIRPFSPFSVAFYVLILVGGPKTKTKLSIFCELAGIPHFGKPGGTESLRHGVVLYHAKLLYFLSSSLVWSLNEMIDYACVARAWA